MSTLSAILEELQHRLDVVADAVNDTQAAIDRAARDAAPADVEDESALARPDAATVSRDPASVFLDCLGDQAKAIRALRRRVEQAENQNDELRLDVEELHAAFVEHERRQLEADLCVNRRLLALEVAAGLAKAQEVS